MAEKSSDASVAYPLLVVVNPDPDSSSSQKVFSLADQKLHDMTPLESNNKMYFTTPQGWVLVVVSDSNSPSDHDDPPGTTYLLNPQDGSRIELPALKDDGVLPENCRCILSGRAAAAAPGCAVLVFDLQSPVLWFCRVGGHDDDDEGNRRRRWTRHGYDIGCYALPEEYCPVPKKKNLFDIAAVNGRFFFFDSNGSLGTLDFAYNNNNDGGGELEARLGAIAVPGIEFSDGITCTHVLESCGELFLVNIAFPGFCVDGLAGELSVYRMDFCSEPPAWRRTRCVGDDRAFLLGCSNFAAACPASGCGLKANCVYWVNGFGEENSELRVFRIDDGSSELLRRFENGQGDQKPFWIVPVVA
ncbi:uncharacterized protein LOC100834639 [Brachypodium distachyon]|uniref:uncharacterized protein LOC100834639 n=1 Tax=Brachypodium distachyon TaxID=15368 RepID=UPI0001C70AF1|nr:uncharacterized protein LOC100834639 [Brachypodium distachyon]|eukprot:XP_003575520.1 uncharacterized protein LOC100834639 [Brachypodium distachyon]